MDLTQTIIITAAPGGATITTSSPVAAINVQVNGGFQGVPGLQNVFVGSTPPDSPNINDIWIEV